jgi:hypothetical protein
MFNKIANQTKMASIVLTIVSTLGGLASAQASSPGGSGGGEGIAAQYTQVSGRVLNAVKISCLGLKGQGSPEQRACAYISKLNFVINNMKVEPRSRDSVLGSDGEPRDAGNNGKNTVFLDVDRWSDKQNETNPNEIQDTRFKQVQLSLHEPLVLAGAEKNDQYTLSSALLGLLSKNDFSFDKLVGKSAVYVNAPNSGNNYFTAESNVVCSASYLLGTDPVVNFKDEYTQAATAKAMDKCYSANFRNCVVISTSVLESEESPRRICLSGDYVIKARVQGLP